jgi:hypothetical protein
MDNKNWFLKGGRGSGRTFRLLCETFENKIADIKANCDLAIEGRDIKIKELEQQIEKMKRHCNCKHRDSEGYCEVKRTYLMDLSYDGCDKWELED